MRSIVALSMMVLMSAVLCNQSLIPSAYAKSETTSVASPAALVNINSATAEELQTIKGVGPTLAGRIIAYRTENGNFKSVDDVMNVQGIGGSKFEKIKSQIAV